MTKEMYFSYVLPAIDEVDTQIKNVEKWVKNATGEKRERMEAWLERRRQDYVTLCYFLNTK